MTEQQIQRKRIKQLESEGYYVLKLIKTNKNGIPDLLAIPPGCPVIFSEVKTPKGKLSKIIAPQRVRRHKVVCLSKPPQRRRGKGPGNKK